MVGYQCAESAGRVLGGGSSINGAVYFRNHQNDFARWVDIYGATGWSYEEVLPYYIKNENAQYSPLEEGYHGFDGPVYVSNDNDSLLTPILLSAFEEAGFEENDINGPATRGYARTPIQYKPNKRVSGASAFIRPALSRPNMRLSVNSFVTRIIIDKTTLNATGVEFVKNGMKYIANVNYEVVLCAGLMSAPILMHSGVGPAAHLESLNISVIADLPVGQNFQDHHYFIGMFLKTNTTFFDYGDFNNEVERYTENLRPLTTGNEALVLSDYGTNTTYPRPNLEILFSSPGGSNATVSEKYTRYTSETASNLNSSALTDASILIALLHPKSVGNITLQSNDPSDRPLINPNLLSEQDDIDTMFYLVNWALSFSNTTAFQNIGGEVTIFDTPGCEGEKYSPEWILCAIAYWTSPGFHGVAANSIGNDTSRSVVNPRLKIHGFGNLRVGDSSIIPECVTGHTSGTTYLVGERVSDFIKEDYGR